MKKTHARQLTNDAMMKWKYQMQIQIKLAIEIKVNEKN